MALKLVPVLLWIVFIDLLFDILMQLVSVQLAHQSSRLVLQFMLTLVVIVLLPCLTLAQLQTLPVLSILGLLDLMSLL